MNIDFYKKRAKKIGTAYHLKNATSYLTTRSSWGAGEALTPPRNLLTVNNTPVEA